MSLRHSTVKSFSYAFQGIKLALKNEPNFRIHILLAIVSIALGIILDLSVLEISILTLTIGFVIILVLLNTTIEALVDLVSPQIKPKAKIAKDVAAASVPFSSILAVCVGVFLFLPKILEKL